MNILPEKLPPGNRTTVPLLRSPRTLRHLPIGLLVGLVIVALDHGEHVAGATIGDLRTELYRREFEAVRS